MTTMRANLRGMTKQQTDVLCELARREKEGRGAQTAADFDGFPTASPWMTGTRYPISESAARSCLNRLVKRGLVEKLNVRPATYRLTGEGRGAVLGA